MPEEKYSLEDISPIFKLDKPASQEEGKTESVQPSGEDLSTVSPIFSSSEPQRVTGKELPFKDLYNPWEVGVVTGPLGWLGGKSMVKLENALIGRQGKLPDFISDQINMPKGDMTAGEKWAQKTGYGSGQGTVREVAENYKKQFRDIGEGKRAIKGGRLINVDQVLEDIAKREALLAEEAKRIERAKTIGGKALNVAERTGEKLGAVTRAFPRTMTGLGALGVGAEATEAYNRYARGDYPGMVISGLGAVGSGLSMVPATTPWTAVAKGVGTAVGALSPFALQGYDYLREKLDQIPLRE